MKIKFVFSAFLFTLFTLQAFSQQIWTLEDCINYAHANNLRIKQTKFQADMAKNDLLQSKLQILPDLNAEAGRRYNFGHQINPYTNQFIESNTITDNYALNSSMNLFSGLVTYNSIKAYEYSALSKLQDVEKEKVNITIEIASAYLQILFNDELLEVAKRQRDVTQLQVERTSKLVDAGSAARGQLLEIKAQLSAEDLNVTNSQNSYNLSVLNLAQILDLDSAVNFKIVKPDSLELDLSRQITDVLGIYNYALAILPHIKSAEYNLMAYERNLAIQKGMASPRLGVYGSWGTGHSNDSILQQYSYTEQLNNNAFKSFSIGLSVPIFNRWDVKRNISNAKISVLNAENTLDMTKQQLYKEIQQSYNDAVASSERYKSASEAVDSYREAFVYTEQKYNVGMVNSVEYNVAKNNFIKAESELLQAKYQYVFAMKILDFYRGIPITL
jgi:outer membrane protein